MEKYTIIGDSCGDLKSTDIVGANLNFVTAPLFYNISGTEYCDDESVNTKELLLKMKQSKYAPKTSCPAPETFAQLMRDGTNNIICVAMSSKLSGTHASATLAANTVRAEQPEKKIFVLDALTASSGSARIIYKLVELIETGKYSFEEITEKITEYRNKSKIKFLLNDLGNLVKSGRMSKVAGIITSIIPIKLVCGDNGAGEIKQYKKVIGFKKGVEAIAEYAAEKKDEVDNLIVISHCHNDESAGILKKLLESKFGFKNIKTLLMRGVATFLANDKGLAVAY